MGRERGAEWRRVGKKKGYQVFIHILIHKYLNDRCFRLFKTSETGNGDGRIGGRYRDDFVLIYLFICMFCLFLFVSASDECSLLAGIPLMYFFLFFLFFFVKNSSGLCLGL